MTDLQRKLRVTNEHNSDGTHNAAAATTLQGLLTNYPTVQSVVTGSRAINGTVYQNTTGRPMEVNITAYGTDGTYLRAYSDSAAAPATIIAYSSQEVTINFFVCMHFTVLSGNYYKVSPNSGSWTLQLWVETY